MKKILAQAKKEFRLFRRDKLLVMLAVLMPVVLILLAGGTQSLRLRNVPLLVYDYDNTPLSRIYLETYGAALTFRFVSNKGEAPERALASGLGRAALIIPQNFDRDARRGAGPVGDVVAVTAHPRADRLQHQWRRADRSINDRRYRLERCHRCRQYVRSS